jgi:chemotaxis protein CheX
MTTTLSLRDTLLSSAKEVFESMVFLALEEVEDLAPCDEAAFLGTVTFIGDIEGCLSVCFGQACARDIAAGMLCMETPEELADEDIVDAIGEIANMVIGTVKTSLQGQVDNITISIPSVILGRQLRSVLGEGVVKTVVHARIGGKHDATFSLIHSTSARRS